MRAGRLLAPLLLAVGLALPAAADTLGVLRENTLTLTQQDGKVTTILLLEGRQMEQVNSAGIWATGSWYLDPQNRFCWTARGAATLCINMPMTVGVGAVWDVVSPTGAAVWKAEIVEGRADLRALSSESQPADPH
jgi:hypothetical protein